MASIKCEYKRSQYQNFRYLVPDGVVEGGCRPEEAKALKDYYQRKIIAKEALRAIIRTIEISEDSSQNTWRLWSLLTNALVELPDAELPHLTASRSNPAITGARNQEKSPTWP
jgi:hypothetical protein